MSTLVDTNVLLRRLEPGHDYHRAAGAATSLLIERGQHLHIAASRSPNSGPWRPGRRRRTGSGPTLPQRHRRSQRSSRPYGLLFSDGAIVYQHWKRLIVERRVTGRRVFDARLVAVMLAHGGAQLLTFNGTDFAGLGVPVLEPQAVR